MKPAAAFIIVLALLSLACKSATVSTVTPQASTPAPGVRLAVSAEPDGWAPSPTAQPETVERVQRSINSLSLSADNIRREWLPTPDATQTSKTGGKR